MRKEKDSYILRFKEPYLFENKEYKEIDLSGVKDLKASDLCEAQDRLTDMGITATVAELNYTYNFLLAAKAAKLPVEFFEEMPGKYAIDVKNLVSGYFLAD